MSDRTLFLIIVACSAGFWLADAFAKSYDEAKQERLAAARAERRAIEVKYETCIHECRIKCGEKK